MVSNWWSGAKLTLLPVDLRGWGFFMDEGSPTLLKTSPWSWSGPCTSTGFQGPALCVRARVSPHTGAPTGLSRVPASAIAGVVPAGTLPTSLRRQCQGTAELAGARQVIRCPLSAMCGWGATSPAHSAGLS